MSEMEGAMIASLEQLDAVLLREQVTYLERVVGILKPALEARLSASVVLDQVPTIATVSAPPERAIEAPVAQHRLPRPVVPTRAERAPRPSASTVNGTDRQAQVLGIIRAGGGDLVKAAALARAVYGDDSEKSRLRVAAVIQGLKRQGLIVSVLGKHGGYRMADAPIVAARPVVLARTTPESASETPATSADWSPVNGQCWHVDGPCADYTRGDFCGHCTDQDSGVLCPKRHRKEQPHERVR